MKSKTLISLAILPVVALAGCDSSKTKVASSSTTKNAKGAYQKCDPNQTNCESSSGGSSGAGGFSGSGGSDSDTSKSSAKGGFGGMAGHSGG